MKELSKHTTPSLVRFGTRDVDYRTQPWTYDRAARFDRWQTVFLKNASRLPVEYLWPACLLLFEGICDLKDVLGIERSGVVYWAQKGVRLDWCREDGSRGARQLGACSVIAHQRCGADPRAGGDLARRIGEVLKLLDPSLPCVEDRVGFGLRCAEAWLFLHLPMYMFANVCGDSPMTPLQRSTLARFEASAALSETFNAHCDNISDDGAALESYFYSQGEDRELALVEKILDAASLADSDSMNDRQLLDRMACRWRGLVDDAERVGPIACLQLAHVINMAAKRGHSPRTVAAYVKYGVPAVQRALCGKDIGARSSVELTKDFVDGLSELRGESLRKAAAYVGHFHRFASEWIEVEPLIQQALPIVARAPSDSNVVWPDEVRLLDHWLKGVPRDSRLTEQTRLVLHLLSQLPVRPSEIFLLQVRNVLVTGTAVEVEFARLGRLHGLKTKSAQRTLSIVDDELAAELLGWTNKRRIEGGLGSDLLFGSRADQRRCFRLGAMYSWLNGALKCATGDPTSCCHHFRHTAIDQRFRDIALGLTPGDDLDQLRADAGHIDLTSTQLSYLHSFPAPLRKLIDGCLAHLPLSSSAADFWSCDSAAKLRQEVHREKIRMLREPTAGSDSQSNQVARRHYWCAIARTAASVRVPDASDSLQLCCPLPCAAPGTPRAWTVGNMLGFLKDIQGGYSPGQAGAQWGLEQKVFECAYDELLAMANLRMRRREGLFELQLTRPAAALEELGIDMQRSNQPKYGIWVDYLKLLSPPDMPREVVEAWDAATKSKKYVRFDSKIRADRWLGFLVSLQLPPSKLVICSAIASDDIGFTQTRNCVSLALAQDTPSVVTTLPRAFWVKAHRGRPSCYLLVADEVEEFNERNGAAFSPAGLLAIVLAIRLASHARRLTTEVK